MHNFTLTLWLFCSTMQSLTARKNEIVTILSQFFFQDISCWSHLVITKSIRHDRDSANWKVCVRSNCTRVCSLLAFIQKRIHVYTSMYKYHIPWRISCLRYLYLIYHASSCVWYLYLILSSAENLTRYYNS